MHLWVLFNVIKGFPKLNDFMVNNSSQLFYTKFNNPTRTRCVGKLWNIHNLTHY
jgi:hypothetical protein